MGSFVFFSSVSNEIRCLWQTFLVPTQGFIALNLTVDMSTPGFSSASNQSIELELRNQNVECDSQSICRAVRTFDVVPSSRCIKNRKEWTIGWKNDHLHNTPLSRNQIERMKETAGDRLVIEETHFSSTSALFGNEWQFFRLFLSAGRLRWVASDESSLIHLPLSIVLLFDFVWFSMSNRQQKRSSWFISFHFKWRLM